jgi:hypothetical protein
MSRAESPESRKRAKHDKHEKRVEEENRRAPPRLPATMDLATYNQAHLKLPCLVQPKMDGCLLRIANMNDKAYVVSSHNVVKSRWETFKMLCASVIPDGWMLEGEFYGNHRTEENGEENVVPVEFRRINAVFQSHQDPNLHVNMQENPADFVVFAFDLIPIDPYAIVRPYFERYAMLKERIAAKQSYENTIKLMPIVRCTTKEEVDKAFERFVNKGYEGAVVRDALSIYESGLRSKTAMKRKPLHDEEFELVDLSIGDGCLKASCAHLTTRAHFGATWYLKKNDIYRYFKLKNEIIGKLVTVQYNLKTEDGIPRSGIIKGIRSESA